MKFKTLETKIVTIGDKSYKFDIGKVYDINDYT
jgi:hypothetical protein